MRASETTLVIQEQLLKIQGLALKLRAERDAARQQRIQLENNFTK